MTPANRATARRALVVGVALLGAACTTENESPPPSPSSTPPAAKPVVLEPEPLWRGRTWQAGDIPNLELRGEADGFVVFDVRTRERTTITARDSGSLLDAWHGYLMFVDGNRILDRSGAVVADRLPGEVIAMSDEYVVLLDRERGEYGVYRRTA